MKLSFVSACLSLGALLTGVEAFMPQPSRTAAAAHHSSTELAAKYTELLKSHPSIDNSGGMPSMDMMLLGTGPDGHCGCLFPDTPEIQATGTGKVVMAGNDKRADGDFLAISMDVMCATS